MVAFVRGGMTSTFASGIKLFPSTSAMGAGTAVVSVTFSSTEGMVVNVIAVSGEQRSVLAPESPSFGEAGLKNVDIELYFWIAGPARLPREIVARLNQEVVAILADAEVREALLKQGMVPGPSTPEAIGTLIRTDVARWKKFISENNITAD